MARLLLDHPAHTRRTHLHPIPQGQSRRATPHHSKDDVDAPADATSKLGDAPVRSRLQHKRCRPHSGCQHVGRPRVRARSKHAGSAVDRACADELVAVSPFSSGRAVKRRLTSSTRRRYGRPPKRLTEWSRVPADASQCAQIAPRRPQTNAQPAPGSPRLRRSSAPHTSVGATVAASADQSGHSQSTNRGIGVGRRDGPRSRPAGRGAFDRLRERRRPTRPRRSGDDRLEARRSGAQPARGQGGCRNVANLLRDGCYVSAGDH